MLILVVSTPVLEAVGNELQAVVHAQEFWSLTPLFNDLVKHGHGARSRDAPGGIRGERFAGKHVSHVQDFDGSPVGGFVDLKVKGPDVVRMSSESHWESWRLWPAPSLVELNDWTQGGVCSVAPDPAINATLSGQDRAKATLEFKIEIMRASLLDSRKMLPGRPPFGEGVVLGVAVGIVRLATATFFLHRVDADLQN